MLKYDSEKESLACAGTGEDLLADITLMTMRVLYSMADGDKVRVQRLLTMYVPTLIRACYDNKVWEKLDSSEKLATTVNLSHLTNALKNKGEQ